MATAPTLISVDVAQFKLQAHVKDAFNMAWVLAAGEPISARHVLLGALMEGSKTRAFQTLGSLAGSVAVPELPAQKQSVDLQSLSVHRGLSASFTVAEKFWRESNLVWGRDFITWALLAREDPSLDEFAREATVPLQALQDNWYRFVTDEGTHRSPNAWTEWWNAAGVALPDEQADASAEAGSPADDTAPTPQTAADTTVQSTDADTSTHTSYPLPWADTDVVPVMGDRAGFRPSSEDSLDAKDTADIFATLLVAEAIQPPFALGLLGDWGVGKTFFMRLMQEKIDTIAGRKASHDGNSRSISRAAQIEFNAWHYVDSDLWASLASHIFDGLSTELRKDEPLNEVRRDLRRQIASSQREKKEAEDAIEAAEGERESAAADLEVRKAERASVKAQSEPYRLKRVWDAVLRVKPVSGDPVRENWPNMLDVRDKAEQTARRLGVTDAIDSAEEAQRAYEAMRDISRRGGALTNALSSAFTGRRAWVSAGLIVVLLVLVMVWPAILEWVGTQFDRSGTAVAPMIAPVLQLMTVVGAVAVWASKNLSTVSSAMSYLEQLRAEIERPREKLDDPGEEEKNLESRMRDLETEIAKDQRRIEDADRQISEAQAEIRRIDAGGLVYDFLEGKVRDSRYLDRLGLISVIRRDFDELGKLLEEWQQFGDAEEDISDVEDYTWDTRPIERIILYIDDLDRCPAKRVVEVLQAVHLILAFDLFVVVVAVDARWLERSLNETYNPWTVLEDGSARPGPVHRFSAHNYLEKIFQIPYSLPEMQKDGYRDLVADMLVKPRTQAKRAASAKAQVEHVPPPDLRTEGPLSLDPASRPDDSEVTPGAATADDSKAIEEPSDETDADEEARRKREAHEAEENIKAMLLHDGEQQFIKALYPFISTPRLAKRFVNIYRLLRVQVARQRDNYPAFVERNQGEYRAVLLLLAISVGYSETAPEIIYDLYSSQGTSFREWVRSLSQRYDDELSTRMKGKGATASLGQREVRLGELRLASKGIARSVDKVAEALTELKGPSIDDRFQTYAEWAFEVGRYSLHWHLRGE